MTAPGIDPLSNIPNPQDSPAEFDADSFAFTQTELPRVISQINALVTWMNVNVNGSPPANESTAAFDITNDKSGQYLRATYAGAKVATVLAGLTVVSGSQWILFNATSGDLTFSPGGGVTINNNVAVSQNSAAILKKVDSNVFDLIVLGGASGGGMTNPMTTAGDVIVGGSAGAPGRLGKGFNGQVLTVIDGNIVWANPTTVTTADFDVDAGSSYAWEGFPADGDAFAAGGGSVDFGAFFPGDGISPGTFADFSGVGLAFLHDTIEDDLYFILLLPGATEETLVEVSGIPFYSTLTTNTATYGLNVGLSQYLFSWLVGSGAPPAGWGDPITITLRQF